LTQIERGKTISFFNELDIETRTMLVTSVSFFNEVAIETKNYPCKWFHFLTSMKSKNHAQRPLFHFLTRLPQRLKNYPRSLLDHGFQEDNALEGDHVKGQKSVMASKGSSLEGSNTLWNDTMSRVMTGVKRSGSNNPIDEITMSTTGSKSSEVEAMGNNAT
jgi:histone deacetylase complex regulatory component SIN3